MPCSTIVRRIFEIKTTVGTRTVFLCLKFDHVSRVSVKRIGFEGGKCPSCMFTCIIDNVHLLFICVVHSYGEGGISLFILVGLCLGNRIKVGARRIAGGDGSA